MSLDEYAVSVLGPGTGTAGFATRSFIGLGGDSLRAMRLTALAQENLGVRLSVSDLLSPSPLGEVLANANANAVDVDRIEPADAPPPALTPMQRGMWLIDEVLGGSTYNLVFTCGVTVGALTELFSRAAAAVAERHATLRTVFVERDDQVTPSSDAHRGSRTSPSTATTSTRSSPTRLPRAGGCCSTRLPRRGGCCSWRVAAARRSC
ncbi:hypothetical protein K7G98_23750 [Saccharothrix sp. MB29]|nr:hypothetical protein [Saccharothrix sp. MB29]